MNSIEVYLKAMTMHNLVMNEFEKYRIKLKWMAKMRLGNSWIFWMHNQIASNASQYYSDYFVYKSSDWRTII